MTQTLPTAPYDIYMRVDFNQLSTGAITTHLNATIGILLGNATSGRTLPMFIARERISGDEQNTYKVCLQRWTNNTTFSAESIGKLGASPFRWIRVNVTSTTVTAYCSFDGKDWINIGTETIATFVGTIDKVGFCAYSESGNTRVVAKIGYFSTTAPS
jgi:hypothetical protein